MSTIKSISALYECSDESGVKVQIRAESARDAAREYVAEGDFESSSATVFHRIAVAELDIDTLEEIDRSSITILVTPEEPPCSSGDGHTWNETSRQGNGGGVIMVETCPHCGRTCTTNTWATNPTSGEQGFTTISYAWSVIEG